MTMLPRLAVVFAYAASARAQIQITDAETGPGQVNLAGTYTQNFDSLYATNTTSKPWLNNSTLPGWYAYRSLGDINNYSTNSGTNFEALSSYGTINQTDRALGTGLTFGDGSFLHFGARFTNATTSLINEFSVTFDGEQWYAGGSNADPADSLTFSYQIFDAGLGSISATTGWVTVDALTFSSPTRRTSFSALDGNAAANRVAGISSSVTGIALAPGQELWTRWTATNMDLYPDDGLGIDNLQVSFGAIPEPASIALILSAAMLATVVSTRRRHRGPV